MKIIQQNSFNPTSEKLEILIIWHLRGVVPGSKVLLFMTPQKKPLSVKQAVLRDIFKKASMSDSTSIIMESPELADERGIQVEYTSN